MLEDLTPPARTNQCGVFRVEVALDTKDRKILADALENVQDWPTKTLSRELKSRGLMLSVDAITKHRNKLCQCVTMGYLKG